MSQQENIVLFPGHGPPTTVGAEKKFNKDFTKEYLYSHEKEYPGIADLIRKEIEFVRKQLDVQ